MGIKEYNAYNTGIFLCSPAIFSAIEESLDNDDSSLSGGIRVLARKGKAKAFDIKDDYWIGVNTKKDRRKAAKLLYSNSIKPAGPGLFLEFYCSLNKQLIFYSWPCSYRSIVDTSIKYIGL
jgi:choline kinase